MPRIYFEMAARPAPGAGSDDETRRGAGMTAHLISLAVAGLVAIALWDGFS